jgi:hypothetical protein
MPERNEVHVNVPLTNVSIAYRNSDYVAEDVWPIVPVRKLSDLYYKYGAERFRPVRTARARMTRAPEVDWTVTTGSYSCRSYALAQGIDDEERDNADAPLNLDVDTTELLTDLMLLDYEIRVMTLLTDTGTWDNDSPGTKWDQDASTPVEDVLAARETIRLASGLRPNTMVLPFSVFNALKGNAEIIEWINPLMRVQVTIEHLQTLFEIPRILVAEAMYDSAIEGQDPVIGDIWGDDVWIGYVAARPGLKQVSAGYTFRQKPFYTRRWREEPRHSDFIEVNLVQDEKVVCAEAGSLLTTCLTA